MPRGRHRHSPPLHRLLPPTAIAGVSLVCALGPWVLSEPSVLRVAAAVAAATAAVGAAVMRRWDVEAGKRVADLTRARASDEWRHEEKVAELETDLDESRELRTKLEHKLRAKRTELANLRNEHAALLRRYATAETERASALEGRRLLEIEATAPEDARELSADAADAGLSPVPPQGVPVQGAPWPSWGEAVAASADVDVDADADADVDDDADADAEAGDEVEAQDEVEVEDEGTGTKGLTPAAFSPAGSALFVRANSALDRIITQRGVAEAEVEAHVEAAADAEAQTDADADADAVSVAEGEVEVEAGTEVEPEADAEAEAEADTQVAETDAEDAPEAKDEPADASTDDPAEEQSAKNDSPDDGSPKGDPDGPNNGGSRKGRSAETEAEAEAGPVRVVTAAEDDPVGKPGAADGHERALAEPVPAALVPAQSAQSGQSAQSELPVLPALPAVRPSGHFTVPTAVAVVPAVPQRRVAVEGGFDFFGTQKEADAFAAVQNEDLADVIGQEALALHKAESEARFKPMDEGVRGIGQVIDLTAHDETEQIDVQGLRTAAS